MRNLSVYHYRARIFVHTEHEETQLELVLNATEERLGKDPDHYASVLMDSLNKAFKPYPNRQAFDYDLYGSLSYTIEEETPEALQEALAQADVVIAAWVKKYRVNAMKETR